MVVVVKNQTAVLTPASDKKPVRVEQSHYEIEVIDSEGVIWPAESWFGHSAISLNDTVYSRAHDEYITTTKEIYLNGGVVIKAITSVTTGGNQKWRNNTGYVLWLYKSEYETLKADLERRVSASRANSMDNRKFGLKNEDYLLLSNNCASNIGDALKNAGVFEKDAFIRTPAKLRDVLRSSKRLMRVNPYNKK